MNLEKIISKSALLNAKRVMRALAASAEAFLHHSFGERYTTTLLSGLLLATVVTMLAGLVPPEKSVFLMPLVTAALFARIVAHLLSVGRRRRAGIHIESRSCGTPWSFWSHIGISAGVVQVLMEPLLCLVVSLLLAPVDLVCAVWLCFAGLALMVKTLMERQQAHEQTLDALDTRMAARNLHATLNQQMNLRPQNPNTPVTVNPAAPVTPARPARGVFQNLDPALQRLMREDATPATPGTIHVQPPSARTDSESAQRAAAVPPQTSKPGRIHVRPARAADSAADPNPQTLLAKPRVVLVRTRPAPAPTLHVSPANSTGDQRPMATPVAQPGGAAVPTPVSPPSPESSETLAFPNPLEVQKTGQGETESKLPSQSETEGVDSGRGIEEHAALCRRVALEASKLGFTVESGTNQLADASPYLLLRKAGVSLAVAMVVTSASGDEFVRLKKCLATGLTQLAVVCPRPEWLSALAQSVHAGLPLEEAMKVGYFTPEEFSAELLRLAQSTEATSKRKRQP